MAGPDTFFGGSITFGTSTVLSGAGDVGILSGGRSAVTVEDIDTSHAGTSGDNKTYIPADLVEGGTYDFEVMYDPDDDIDALVGVSQTITITYPLPSGKMSAATCAFTGYINSWSEELPIDDKMTCSISIKVASDPTMTAAS